MSDTATRTATEKSALLRNAVDSGSSPVLAGAEASDARLGWAPPDRGEPPWPIVTDDDHEGA